MAISICGQPMIPITNYKFVHRIRLGSLPSLIFFALALATACREAGPREITIIWKDSQAVGIAVPEMILDQLNPDSLQTNFRVYVQEERKIPVLGVKEFIGNQIRFTPAIPFSRGLRYDIVYGSKLISTVFIPTGKPGRTPTVVATYPSKNILPENMLKMYLQFSQPMREGQSLKHVSLLNSDNDTLSDIFLELQPELWNKEGTVLTLWLDPGRIKRDLVPNKTLGNPLERGKKYKIIVSSDWTNVEGQPLSQIYSREFTVGERDSLSPSPKRWTLQLPAAGTREALFITTGESLDYFLLQETVTIISPTGEKMAGTFSVSDEETILRFAPAVSWPGGEYRLQVASYLEDLAGNNLEHVFDRDVTLKRDATAPSTYERRFTIK